MDDVMASRLPVEVVTHVMRFLSVSDRKEAALVNSIWYEASLDPILQDDVVLHFHALTTNDRTPQITRRNLPHLIVDQFDNSLNSKVIILKSCEQLSQSLQSLSLKSSNITESTFVELLSKCNNLVSLNLSCCNSLFMSGKLLEMNGDMQKLKSVLGSVQNLDLSAIRYMSDSTFNRIVTVCPNLSSLSLGSAQLTFNSSSYMPRGKTKCASSTLLTFDNILEYLKLQSPKMKLLNLSRTALTDDALETLVTLEGLKLEELVLVCCKDISDSGISVICKYQSKLKTIDLKGCVDLTDGAINLMSKNLLVLENLKLGKCRRVSDHSIKQLKHLPCLELVDLSENYLVTSQGLIEGLCGNINIPLVHLNLNCCPSVTDSFILSMCKVVTHLVHLDLGSCFPLTDHSLVTMSKNLKHLRYLRLAWCKEITDLGLLGYERTDGESQDSHEHDEHGKCRCTRKYNSTEIFRKPTGNIHLKNKSGEMEKLVSRHNEVCTLKNLSILRELDLSACPKITDTGLTQVVKFKELRSLNLSMVQITDLTVHSVTSNNPSLEHLSLAQCAALTDDAIECVAKRLPRLTSLDISKCDKLTNKSIQFLKEYSSRLRTLDVSFCENISVAAVDNLETSRNLKNVQKRLLGGSF
ncbi:F-box/LRR-repeat protein 14-like [Mizuhopecten yessoensis]|uniref:Leucine-rich repeat-containing protein 29 n=1 Tax=Mizuhopecten yessoensis TaxID=6573 RepID=A0A210QXY5_MIZYE|nr:F-box/LRR-repeat protein 14-like [Mizuhopecten yessoensis]OWF53562.1 Leucine-rich repeat-containing protein 29 [Mizuhopecten yessoensis]